MKHLWYCQRCHAIFFMPWLTGEHLHIGPTTLKEVERQCDVCHAIQAFRMLPNEE